MLHDRTWMLIGRKLSNEASPDELRELEQILKENPELHFSMHAMAEVWQQTPSHDVEELEEAYQKHFHRMRSEGIAVPGQVRKRRALIRYFLASLVLLAVVITVSNYKPRLPLQPGSVTPVNVPSEISTRNGSRTNIVLPDGTKVWLNSGSKLTYDKSFGDSLREVLLNGEAYFDVTRNVHKPFVIHTAALDIKVLGTEFNVKSYPEEKTTEASLVKGSIEVILKDRQAEKIILKPNEKLVITNDKPSVTNSPGVTPSHEIPIISVSHLNYFSRDSTILETSWVQNRLVFEDQTFGEIAKRMSRWYGVSFQFAGNDLQKLRFTGSFTNETVGEALKAMQITAQFKFRIVNNEISIYN